MLWSAEELPEASSAAGKDFKSLRFPLWTQNKARLIQTYLRLFVYITHHGTYIDGFAAPQDAAYPETWSAKLVLEMEPKWFRDFWLCDISAPGIKELEILKRTHEDGKRSVRVIAGDFNKTVHQVFASGKITEKVATFALLDQRTFECDWDTVVTLSRHKTGRKIELFYFFATGWIDRSLAAVAKPSTKARVAKWWGRPDWASLRGMDGIIRAQMVADRFKSELGYATATVYPIHSEEEGGRVMYHMIHATDHPEAMRPMVRAYRKVSGRPDLEQTEEQLDMLDLLKEIQSEGA
jgi:three-Cys-motif partner protein